MNCTDGKIITRLNNRSGINDNLCPIVAHVCNRERPVGCGILLITDDIQVDNQIITHQHCRITWITFQDLRL